MIAGATCSDSDVSACSNFFQIANINPESINFLEKLIRHDDEKFAGKLPSFIFVLYTECRAHVFLYV